MRTHVDLYADILILKQIMIILKYIFFKKKKKHALK